MSTIFYILLLITLVFAGSAIYRISSSVREYNRDREQKIGLMFGIGTDEAREAEFDLFLLRWACVFGVITLVWGVIEGVVRLLS